MDVHSLEAFALATDRTKALEQFIPGTDDHYFHACLVHEQNGNLKEVDLLLAQWNKRLGETQRFQEIRNRRALLGYEADKEGTREYLRYHVGLDFSHTRDVEGQATDFPTKLDVSAVSRDAARRHGYSSSNSSDLAGFTDAAIEWLADEPADGQRLRSLLQRMKRPDHAKLVTLVAAELRDKHTSGFGALPIHNVMLHDQLQALLKQDPALKKVDAFVWAFLKGMQPGPDVDWQNNAVEREAWLTRLWDFVHDLAPKFNPLKAHVLFHRLDHDRRQGGVDRARLLSYLKLPRQVPYANADYLKTFVNDERFSLGQDFRQVTQHAVVSNDEELVRELLAQVLRDATDMKPWDTLISEGFLKQVFASTKMCNGIGDMEKWFSVLNDPAFCQALKEKIEIAFAPTNPVWFQADQAVSLDVDVKNVATLTVKVFEVNTLNYFLANGRDVDTSVDLDGLVASEEQTVSYSEGPMRRVRRTFSFPSLSKPGVYIVELIGGGISSRALIRKGKLRFVERVGAAGHVLTVLDEARNALVDASIWLGGHEYRPSSDGGGMDGSITIPFSARPGRQKILLRHGGITALETFQHQGEEYALSAGLYVDRESLLTKKEASLVVRAGLSVNGFPVSLKLLEEVTLVIQSTDRDGVSASHEISGFSLFEEKESVYTFQVPEKLSAMSFKLRAKVQSLSQGKKLELSAENAVTLNSMDADAIIEGLHLSRNAAGFVVHHLGKSGEARPASALNFTLQHRDVVPELHVTLQTDDTGRVELGHLRDVLSVTATTPSGVSERWSLPRDSVRTTTTIHVRVGEAFRVPFMGVAPLLATGRPQKGGEFPDAMGKPAAPENGVAHSDAALLERLGAGFVRDHFTALSRTDGYLEVAGLPAGDYELFLKRDQASIAVRVVPGVDRAGWIAGDKRHVERRNARPLQISRVTGGDSELTVALGNAGEMTRVHVFATRFVPNWSSAHALSRGSVPGGRAVEVFRAPSNYVSGRDIGDEYRYILERRQAKTFAGNMLARPGLLLNPWAVRGTETAMQDARGGGAYAASPAPSMQAMAPPAPEAWQQGGGSAGNAANLDFLAHPASVLTNLVPDREGLVRIPRDALLHANQIRIVAVDPVNTVCRDALLPEAMTPHADLRLKLALDAERHFSERKQVTALAAGQPLEIADITTAKMEVYDTLGRVYRLYRTLTNDANLTTFGFILRWLSLTESEKQAKYSEFACHELSFFLSRKDPEFFERVIKPYLRNKMHKTFMDRYLLGDDLSDYRKPWAFHRLNIVERILLARRFDDEGGPMARHGRDLNDLVPRDLERANHLFASAIQGSALEAGDALGIGAQVMKAEAVALDALGDTFGAALGAFGAALGAPGGGGRAEESQKSRAMPSAPAPARMSKEKSAKKMRARDSESEDSPSEIMAEADAGQGGDFDMKDRDVASRAGMRQFYQKLDKTMEWAENNWWHLGIEQHTATLIGINGFWRDFANHRAGPFLSPNLAVAAGNFAEMMCALAVLDLPFSADKPTVTFEGARMRLTNKGLAVAFHKEIKPVDPSTERVPVLVSQNYFRDDDRTRYERDESVDNYVTGEFLINVVYVCQVVLTNPTSSHQKLDLLLQIPSGAMPVRNGFVTRGKHVELSSYATESIEYAFYFPAAGSFPHFPVHVAKNEQLIASTPPARLEVVRELTTVDKTSWAWLSQHGSDDDVLMWLDANNVDRIAVPDASGVIGLERIAWRMKDRAFYDPCLALLTRRHIWNNTLWAYAVFHHDVPNVREFLKHQEAFLDRCGSWLESTLVRINPVERNRYQHLEYAPLVNARTQKLGPQRRILNDRFSQQYSALMAGLRYQKTLWPAERLAVAYYLFLQDRVDEALQMFDGVPLDKIETALQADYLRVYAEFCRERPELAREVATRHKDTPVDRWRVLFSNALAQLDEISGAGAQVVDEKDRDQRQAQLAASEPDFELTIEKKTVNLVVQNLTAVRVNYYRMDIELLFSRQPFVQQQSAQFSFIKPNRSDEIVVPAGQTTLSFALPDEYAGANVIIEVVAAGKRKSQACYAHELSLQIVENYGQVRVAHLGTGKPLSKTYVKVYSRMQGGEVKFFKDGYTDQRGVFDYTSLNSNELDVAERFSVLILHDQHGGVIREAAPPKR